jgi:hypothetical protein
MPSAEQLCPEHLQMLQAESGLSLEVIRARGYRTIREESELAALGFAPRQRRVPGLLLPLHTTDGSQSLSIYRPDNPRVVDNRRKRNADGTYAQKVIKYEQPQGVAVRIDCPPPCRPQLADPAVPLFITEGQKKADALASREACALALTGVWNWKSRNDYGGTTFANDLDYVAWTGRTVYLVFDSDVTHNHSVRQALLRFTEHLQRKKAHVTHIYLPHTGAGKTGVDDWLVATGSSIADLVALAEGPRLEVQPAPELVELLDGPPPLMSRPLALIDGQALAATWCYVKTTTTETRRKDGTIVRHEPPLERYERCLYVVRGDGLIFGRGAHRPLAELGVEVHLPERPRADRLLSTPALKAFAGGRRPAPADVFQRVKACIDRFIDFDHSLAGQETMAELVACYVLSTWFLDAFTVAGFLWPNGDRGSGKTQLLLVVCELAYLGQVILASGSFAALRDLADYGATLAFDDAEDLADARSVHADKRALLLAGNRRGNTIPLKEKQADQSWVTRHVNTFAFRLFSAIRLPDHVLASRTIIVPLIRTPDRYRANADPLDDALWPHERRQLVDDLWCLALAHLPELKPFETQVNARARLTGRSLEPWRALLAVAAWLEEGGVAGLWARLEQLSVDYQTERTELEVGDFTSLVIRGLATWCASHASCASCASHLQVAADVHWLLSSSQLAEAIAEMTRQSDTASAVGSRLTQRVGLTLSKMRFQKPPRPGGQGRRMWLVTAAEIRRWAAAYAIPLADPWPPAGSAQAGTAGPVGPPGADETRRDGPS